MAVSIFGININSTLDGLKKGLEYDVRWAAAVVAAVRHIDAKALTPELASLVQVAVQFLQEVTDEAGAIKNDLVKVLAAYALLGIGHDPMAGSRKLMQDHEAKFGKADPKKARVKNT